MTNAELIEWAKSSAEGWEMSAQSQVEQSNRDFCAREADRFRVIAERLERLQNVQVMLGDMTTVDNILVVNWAYRIKRVADG